MPTSTLGDWVAGASDLLPPLVALLKQRTLADILLHTDDAQARACWTGTTPTASSADTCGRTWSRAATSSWSNPGLERPGTPTGVGRLPWLPGGGRLQGLRVPLRPHLSTSRVELLDARAPWLRTRPCRRRHSRRHGALARAEAVRRGAPSPAGAVLLRGTPEPTPSA